MSEELKEYRLRLKLEQLARSWEIRADLASSLNPRGRAHATALREAAKELRQTISAETGRAL